MTDEKIIEFIPQVTSFAELLGKLGLKSSSGSGFTRLKKRVKELDLDTSHFKTTYHGAFSKGGTLRKTRRTNPMDLFVEDITYQTSHRRYYTNMVDYACVICGISDWQGEQITLQIDHIDGNTRNNLLVNLRLMCPNCHSQTETWGVQKKHRKPL